jgi:hypothetical protein
LPHLNPEAISLVADLLKKATPQGKLGIYSVVA